MSSTPGEIGDRGSFDFQPLYVEFQPRIQRYLARLLGASDAEDLTQEVFAKVGQALPHFRGDCSISTWIYRIATNTAYDRLRSRVSHRESDRRIDRQAPIADESPAVDHRLVRKEMNACIDAFVARLPPDYRAVVILSEYEGLTNREIADTLRVSLATVKIRLHRARARLRKELGRGCDFYRDGRNELACDPKRRGVSRDH